MHRNLHAARSLRGLRQAPRPSRRSVLRCVDPGRSGHGSVRRPSGRL